MTLEFALALVALLLAPGPTNTLLALAGAERGWVPALRLLPAAFLAYAASVLPLALAGEAVMPAGTLLRDVVTLMAALWVAALAVRLWRIPRQSSQLMAVSGRNLFITTLVNPKGLIIGLVLLPAQASLAPSLALFALVLAAASAIWIGLGAQLARQARMPLLRRVSATWLGLVAMWLGSAAFSV